MKKLEPFNTDGCSGNLSWMWARVAVLHNFLFRSQWSIQLPWHDDCVEHDRAYHVGGARQERLFADTKLMLAVASLGYPVIAVLMFLGVRLGGYGWRAEMSYRLLKLINWKAIRFNWGYGYGPKYRYEDSTRKAKD